MEPRFEPPSPLVPLDLERNQKHGLNVVAGREGLRENNGKG
jgi:hypothetical protein